MEMVKFQFCTKAKGPQFHFFRFFKKKKKKKKKNSRGKGQISVLTNFNYTDYTKFQFSSNFDVPNDSNSNFEKSQLINFSILISFGVQKFIGFFHGTLPIFILKTFYNISLPYLPFLQCKTRADDAYEPDLNK